MDFTSGHRAAVADSSEQNKPKRRRHSIFEIPSNLIDSYRLIELISSSERTTTTGNSSDEREAAEEKHTGYSERRTCNTCKYSFDSLHDQRAHFKSDSHRFNIKLSIAGKDTVKEDDYDEWSFNSLVRKYDIKSISSSEDEDNREFGGHGELTWGLLVTTKQKVFVRLPNGEMISFWKCLILGDYEKICFEHDLSRTMIDDDTPFMALREVIEKLLNVINECRNGTCLRVVLLAGGGHFAGCVFDGNTVVTHKTFHRYVARAKAGKKQSSEDAGGKIAHSAGASIRRHNELALKKVCFNILIDFFKELITQMVPVVCGI